MREGNISLPTKELNSWCREDHFTFSFTGASDRRKGEELSKDCAPSRTSAASWITETKLPRGIKGQRMCEIPGDADLCEPVAISDELGYVARDGAPQGDTVLARASTARLKSLRPLATGVSWGEEHDYKLSCVADDNAVLSGYHPSRPPAYPSETRQGQVLK